MLIFDGHKSIVIKDQSGLLIKEKLELEKNKMFYLRLIGRESIDYESTSSLKPIDYHEDTLTEIHCEIGCLKEDSGTFLFEPGKVQLGKIIISGFAIWRVVANNSYVYVIRVKDVTNNKNDFTFEFLNKYKLFFDKVIPDINERMSSGEEWNNINFFFYYNYFRETDYWEDDPERIGDGDIMNSVQNLILIPPNQNIYGESPLPHIILKSKYTYNKYIISFFNKYITDLKYKWQDNVSYYEGRIEFLPAEISKEISLGGNDFGNYANYIELYLLVNIMTYFDKNKCIEAWKNNPTSKLPEYETLEIKNYLWQFYNCIKYARIWHYYDGQRRVGRDDHDWEEETIVIPVVIGYRLTEKMISLLNKLFEADLAFQPQFCRYYSFRTYNSDWTSTFFGREGGPICNQNFVIKILNSLIPKINDSDFLNYFFYLDEYKS